MKTVLTVPEEARHSIPKLADGILLLNNINEKGDEYTVRIAGKGDWMPELMHDSTLILRPLTPRYRIDFQDITVDNLLKATKAAQRGHQRLVHDIIGMGIFDRVDRLLSHLQELLQRLDAGNQVLKLTHTEIGFAVGSTRETVTGHLRKLRQDGYIDTGYGEISLLKPLKQVAS